MDLSYGGRACLVVGFVLATSACGGDDDANAARPKPERDGAVAPPTVFALPEAGSSKYVAPHTMVDAGVEIDMDASLLEDAGLPTPTTLADFPGLADFDFAGTTLVYRVAGDLFTCPLLSCSSGSLVPNVGARDVEFAVAGQKIFFIGYGSLATSRDIFSIQFDGTNRRRNQPSFEYLGSNSLSSLSGGVSDVRALFRSVPRLGRNIYENSLVTMRPNATNSGRIGRPTPNLHSSYGSNVVYFPAESHDGTTLTPPSIVTTGATVPTPVSPPSVVAVSPRGPSVLHPMVIVRRGLEIEACPTSADCTEWIPLGQLGRPITLDGEFLYVGRPDGLSRCTLAEIATVHRCTLSPLVDGEAVEAPLYLTVNYLYYRSGTRVRRVSKRS